MSAIFPILLLLLMLACIGFLYTEGMWSNAVRLINVVTAALLATNFWEPLARLLENNLSKACTYLWDFIALWGLFAVSFVVMRTLTGLVCRVKVRFLGIADRVGGVLFAALIGWVMVCFTTMTLHTAPLARTFMFGAFDPEKKVMWGLAPDHKWLRFVEWVSRGALCRSASEEDLQQGRYHPRPDASEREKGLCVFNGRRFIQTYAQRRASLEDHLKSKGAGLGSLLAEGAPAR